MDERASTWLRDEREVALNDILSLSVEIADHCEDAAARLSNAPEPTPVAGLLEQVALQRRRLARRIERLLRAHGELPGEPDPDAEVAHRAVQWVKAAVASDEERVLLQTRLEQEARLAEAIEKARALDLPPDAERCLEQVAREAGEGRVRIEDALRAAEAWRDGGK